MAQHLKDESARANKKAVEFRAPYDVWKLIKPAEETLRKRKRHPHHACAQQHLAQCVAFYRFKPVQQEENHHERRKRRKKLSDHRKEKRLFVRHAAFEVHGEEFEIQFHRFTLPARKAV